MNKNLCKEMIFKSQKVKGQDVQDFRQYLRKNITGNGFIKVGKVQNGRIPSLL